MFSRREPTQPQKVMMNMRTPTTISMTAGSTDRCARAVSERQKKLITAGARQTKAHEPYWHSTLPPHTEDARTVRYIAIIYLHV